MKKRRFPEIKLQEKYFPMAGGEDLITPAANVKPGRAMLTQNYELDEFGRYRQIDGYEAFDGRPKPSDASYWVLNFDIGTAEIAVEDTVTGAGGASGEVLIIEVTSGTWDGGDAEGYLVLFNVTGTYVDDEVLSVSGAKAIADGTATERGAETDADDSIWLLATIEAIRDDIAIVAGSGNILGVWQYKGTKYAFRNNSVGTAAVMFKSSATGWTACDLGESLSFDTGAVAFVEGETVTKGGVTAVVRRVVVTDGTWTAGDAEGYFTITGRAGGNFTAGAITGSGSGAADATGGQTANAFAASGRFEFDNENFGGHAGTYRMYGVDGVNKGFEWDGTYFVWITTGMTTDTPSHLTAHRKHLFYSFSGGSLQHCAPGKPYIWSVVIGAAELGMGDEITGLMPEPNSLVIFSRNSTKILYGYDVNTWDLQNYRDEAGAIEWTLQSIGAGIFLDDRGLTGLVAAQEYGDFKSNTLSKFVNIWLITKLGNVQSSARIKEKNQYRLFFDDMRVLTLTLDKDKVVGFTRQLYDKLPVCVCSSEDATGLEEIFFGSTDGFVYQLDKGTSFNGEPIESVLRLHFNNLKSSQRKKRIRRVIFELKAPRYTYLFASIDYNYGGEGNPAVAWADTLDPKSPSGYWDINDWDELVWDGQNTDYSTLIVDGSGKNFSLMLYCSGVFELQDDEESPREGLTGAGSHTFQGYTVHYNNRGIQR